MLATQSPITDLVVNSSSNCYQLTPSQMKDIQDKGITTELTPGTYVIRLKEGFFDYVENANNVENEAIVLLWIYGGKFKNLKTKKQVGATWSTLNGYDDTMTLAVSETSKLCAFFFDTEVKDNAGDITVSVVRVDEYREFN